MPGSHSRPDATEHFCVMLPYGRYAKAPDAGTRVFPGHVSIILVYADAGDY